MYIIHFYILCSKGTFSHHSMCISREPGERESNFYARSGVRIEIAHVRGRIRHPDRNLNQTVPVAIVDFLGYGFLRVLSGDSKPPVISM